MVWPPAAARMARAYVDQLACPPTVSARIGSPPFAARWPAARRASGAARRTALTQLATQLDADASSAGDAKEGTDAGGRGSGTWPARRNELEAS